MTVTPYRNAKVHDFLCGLQEHLNAALPSVVDVPLEVDKEAIEVFGADPEKEPKKHLFREPAFVSKFITPAMHRFLMLYSGFDETTATAALISENSVDRKRGYANKTVLTAYPFRHPFGKTIGASASEIVNRWYGVDSPLTSKHPDLCLAEPHRILFEVKYLRSAGAAGRTELVKTVYEAFFYRGLAPVVDGKRPWTYEFAVALIYDGTRDATLLKAWNKLRPDVRDALWNSANVFVMPLRGVGA